MKKTIHQLDFERRRVEAQLRQGDIVEAEEERLIAQLTDIDLAIAASPAREADELRIKIERFIAVFHPMPEPMVEDCLEHVLLAAILKDVHAMAAGAN